MNCFMLWLSDKLDALSRYYKCKVSSDYKNKDIQFVHRNADGSYSKVTEIKTGWTIKMSNDDIVDEIVEHKKDRREFMPAEYTDEELGIIKESPEITKSQASITENDNLENNVTDI